MRPKATLRSPSSAKSAEVATLRAEQVKLVYGSLTTALLASLLNTIVIASFAVGHATPKAIQVWVTLSGLVFAYRVIGLAGYRRAARAAGADGPETLPWLKRFLFGCWAAGAVWGLAPVLLFATHSLPHQIFLAFVLSGVAGGSITTLSPLREAQIPYSVAITVPLALRFIFSGTSLGHAVALLVSVFLAFSILSGLKAHASIVESLRLRIRLAQSEQVLQDTGRLLQVGGWGVDLPTLSMTWTREIFRIHELLDDQQPELRNALDFYPPPGRAVLEAAVDNCIRTGTPWDLQTEFITAKGNRRWIRCLGHAEFRHGKAVRLAGSLQDITQSKETEADLIAAKDMAEAATRAKSQFLTTMSHEIRTPMNGVLGLSKLLMGTNLTEHQQRLAQGICGSGETLLTVINDVLDFSRIEAGRLEIAKEPFDLASAIDTVVQLLKPLADKKALNFVVALPRATSTWFIGDGSRIRQVLLNIVGNAVKFTDAGQVSVTVSVEQAQGHLEKVTFAVRDTGPGIPLEMQKKLFLAFSQVDESAARRFGGSGLGLAISRQLVELMEGSIGLVSEVGKGTTFFIELPLERAPAPAATVRRSFVKPAWQRPPHVLVVEDNDVNQIVAQQLLEKLGCVVQLAADGSQGVTKWQAGAFDLIFMDCQMPGMDGFAATRAIRAQEKGDKVPIIALTANVFQEDRDKCTAAGMTGHIAKPVSISGLAAGLQQHLPALVQTELGARA